jgi:hypothetical protein
MKEMTLNLRPQFKFSRKNASGLIEFTATQLNPKHTDKKIPTEFEVEAKRSFVDPEVVSMVIKMKPEDMKEANQIGAIRINKVFYVEPEGRMFLLNGLLPSENELG